MCPCCRSRSTLAAAPPTAQQQGLGGAPRATQPALVNGTGQAGPVPAAAGAAAVQQQPSAHQQDPALPAVGQPSPGQAPAAGFQQANAASVGDVSVAAHAPAAPPTAAAVAAPVAVGAAAAAAAPQPAPGAAEGQSGADAQPGPAAAPQNPVLSAARMVAARIAGQRPPQVPHGDSSHAGCCVNEAGVTVFSCSSFRSHVLLMTHWFQQSMVTCLVTY